jgi:DNA polymerase-3 subunit epsilon
MIEDKILFIDTETGGLDPNVNSLLSIGFAVWQNFKIIDKTEILINDGKLNVTEQSLKINQIDLESHKKNALYPKDAIQQIKLFLDKHFPVNQKITLAGHNVNFDVNFLKAFLNANNFPFESRFSHRFIDTSSILFYLYLSGKIKERTISSDQAFHFFNIQVDNRHSALGDAIATSKLFTILLKKIYKRVKTEDLKEGVTLFTQ